MTPDARSSHFAILGLLSLEPQSGYDLRKAARETIGHFWSESYGQIYPALRALEAEGLVRPHVRPRAKPQEGRSDRQVWEITEQGHEALERWMVVGPRARPPRHELLLKLFFGSTRTLASQIEHVRPPARPGGRPVSRCCRALGRRVRSARAAGTSRAAPFWLMTLELRTDHADAVVAVRRVARGAAATSRARRPRPTLALRRRRAGAGEQRASKCPARNERGGDARRRRSQRIRSRHPTGSATSREPRRRSHAASFGARRVGAPHRWSSSRVMVAVAVADALRWRSRAPAVPTRNHVARTCAAGRWSGCSSCSRGARSARTHAGRATRGGPLALDAATLLVTLAAAGLLLVASGGLDLLKRGLAAPRMRVHRRRPRAHPRARCRPTVRSRSGCGSSSPRAPASSRSVFRGTCNVSSRALTRSASAGRVRSRR